MKYFLVVQLFNIIDVNIFFYKLGQKNSHTTQELRVISFKNKKIIYGAIKEASPRPNLTLH